MRSWRKMRTWRTDFLLESLLDIRCISPPFFRHCRNLGLSAYRCQNLENRLFRIIMWCLDRHFGYFDSLLISTIKEKSRASHEHAWPCRSRLNSLHVSGIVCPYGRFDSVVTHLRIWRNTTCGREFELSLTSSLFALLDLQ